MSDERAFRFTHAIVRRPGAEVVAGLRAEDRGNPDPARFAADHAAYVGALEAAGVTVTVLDPLSGFPDGVFVEDTALCLPEGAVVLRPGAPSRAGEAPAMAPVLARFFERVESLPGPGTIDGGDVLWTGREILVGRSARTDAAGIAALARIVAGWGHRLRAVATPAGVLHFKSDCALIDRETVLATRRLAASGCFAGYRVVEVPEGEEPAANVVRVNEVVLMPAGYPRTAEALTKAGCEVVALPNGEAAKLDGGMSCLSLRFTPTRS